MFSTQSAVSDGTLSTLAISLDYWDRSEINVYINGVYTTAWTWTTPTSSVIQFTAGPLANGTEVLVRRITDMSAVRHDYTGGAQFTYQTLDENFEQILHIAQEALEIAGDSEFTANLDLQDFGWSVALANSCVGSPDTTAGALYTHTTTSTVSAARLQQCWHTVTKRSFYRIYGTSWGAWVEVQTRDDSGWIQPTLLNSYTHRVGNPLVYRRINGVVYVQGVVERATLPSNNVDIFVLPAEFRPAKDTSLFHVWLCNNLATQSLNLDVLANGSVRPTFIATLGGTPSGAGGMYINANFAQ